MKKSKWVSLLLAGVMTLALAACGSQDTVTNNPTETVGGSKAETTETKVSTQETEETEAPVKPDEPAGQLIIGSTTDLSKEFYDAAFDNTAFNYKMYSMLHDGSTIAFTKEGKWEVNGTYVSKLMEADNENGSKTYTITLQEGLVWSDGSPMTAKDYVFAILLESSPQMMEVDGYPANGFTHLEGFDAFAAGETTLHSGVRLIDDKNFSITVKAEELPYHYDLAYAAVTPRPMEVLAPECDVVDSEDGASVSGEFTADLLMKTINDPDTGYRYNPQVVSGPYKLMSYDDSGRQGVFEVNSLYAGDYRGVKPLIKTVILKTVKSETQLNELEAGQVDLLFGISGGESIGAGLDLVDKGIVSKTTYFRNGYGKITFDCSQFPTDSVNVRQAIALTLDRNEFARQYSGGYASVVHAAYGLAQWEYQDSKDWIDENLDTYEKDLDRARELLIADGWILNKDGAAYQDGDGLRYKDVDGELKSLTIEWCNTSGNPVSELLSTMLPESMAELGMELLATTTDFPTLSAAMSHEGAKVYNMYNLGTGFSNQHSPWYYYSMDEIWMTAGYNSNWIKDQELADAADALQSIPYDEEAEWLNTWQTFIKTWNVKLPDIPLYSDEYHDFYSIKLNDWDQTSIWSWSNALLDAWVAE